jgi:hypothetical protein
MAASGASKTTGLTPLRIGIVVLALATAIIHIVLAIPLTLIGFYLNGLGYIGLTAALFLPQLHQYRRHVRGLLMGYTGLTVVLWVVLGQPYTAIGYVDKAIVLALVGLLWLDQRRSNQRDDRYRVADAAH